MKKLIPILLLQLSNVLLLSCNQENSKFPATGQVALISGKLVADLERIWTKEKTQKFADPEAIPGSRFKHASAIGFCFIDFDTLDSYYRLQDKDLHDRLKWEIAQKLLQEYGERAQLNLFYLNTCSSVGKHQLLIRIALVTIAEYYVSETDYQSDNLGFAAVGPTKEQKNDYTFVHFAGANLVVGTQIEEDGEEDDDEGDVRKRSDLSTSTIIHVALHEFGHALGFLHEHLRQDATSLSLEPENPLTQSDTTKYLGAYDSESVMSYYSGDHPWLSNADVSAIQEIYCQYNPALIINNNFNCPTTKIPEDFSHCSTSQTPTGKTKFIYDREPIGEFNLCQSSEDPNRFYFELPPEGSSRNLCFLGLEDGTKNPLTLPVCVQFNRYTNEAIIQFDAQVKYYSATPIGTIIVFPDDSLIFSQMARNRESSKYFIDNYPHILGKIFQHDLFSLHPIWTL